jgi:hypothetical protein
MSTGAGARKVKTTVGGTLLYAVVEKDTRQLVDGVNVVVSGPIDMLALLLHNKVVTDRLRQSLRYERADAI